MDSERWQRYSRPGPRSWPEAGGEEPPAPRSLGAYTERFLLQLAIAGLVVLVVVQTLHTLPTLRHTLARIEALEGHISAAQWRGGARAGPATGTPHGASDRNPPAEVVTATAASPPGRLTVALISQPSAPRVRILVNGKQVGDFGDGSVTVHVTPGQELALDASDHPGAATFRVVEVQGLVTPALGTEWTARQEVTSLGIVRSR